MIPDKTLLLLGFGKAGKRHAYIAKDYGYTVTSVDPNEPDADYRDVSGLLDRDWTAAIIATPPALHLDYIELLTPLGMPILCEKPLCGLGELERAKQLVNPHTWVFQNYRWHQVVRDVRLVYCSLAPEIVACLPPFTLYSVGQRDPMPKWGTLVDHLSHGLDIFMYTYGSVEVSSARHLLTPSSDTWLIEGTADGHDFIYNDTASTEMVERRMLFDWHDMTDGHGGISTRMFDFALLDFLWRRNAPTTLPAMVEALSIQEQLEKINAITR